MAVDAVVVGAGPNGLTAAITLAQAGLDVHLYEARSAVGGGASTRELTLPGFRHDPCSAVHPLGVGSPVFRSLPLAEHGLRWIHPELPLAQTLDNGSAGFLARDVARTADGFGVDADAYRRLLGPFLGRWDDLAADVLRPPAGSLPRAPLLLSRFGLRAAQPASMLLHKFDGAAARTLLAGLAAHVLAPLTSPFTAGAAMLFALAGHEVGWPIPEGGSQSLADALASHFVALGGSIHLGAHINSIDELPDARAYLFDVSPRALASIAGSRLPHRSARRLARTRYGPAVFKVDYAMAEPVPWKSEECRQAGTVHVAGSVDEIATSLRDANAGRAPSVPFLITSQPTLIDASRAPAGKHVFWAYGHVPNGWTGDALPAIEDQLERFAPGFRDLVIARHVSTPADSEAANPNNVGGNITIGRTDGLHAVLRPSLTALVPYASGNRSIYLCSAATSPGPGVHGMCGYYAARTALRRVWRMRAGAG